MNKLFGLANCTISIAEQRAVNLISNQKNMTVNTLKEFTKGFKHIESDVKSVLTPIISELIYSAENIESANVELLRIKESCKIHYTYAMVDCLERSKSDCTRRLGLFKFFCSPVDIADLRCRQLSSVDPCMIFSGLEPFTVCYKALIKGLVDLNSYFELKINVRYNASYVVNASSSYRVLCTVLLLRLTNTSSTVKM